MEVDGNSSNFLANLLAKATFGATKRKERDHSTGVTPESKKSARDFLDRTFEDITARTLNMDAGEVGAGAAASNAAGGKENGKNNGQSKGKGKGRRGRGGKALPKVQPITGSGTVEARLGIIERMMILIMNIVSRHDFLHRQDAKENNVVMIFQVANLVTRMMIEAKNSWDKDYVPGKEDPTKRSFRSIAWELLWSLAEKAVDAADASTHSFPEADEVRQSIQLLRNGEPARFFAVQLSPKDNKDKEDDPERRTAAQIWVIRFPLGGWGQQANAALYYLHEAGHLETLMDALVREDRAPRGSMMKMLELAMDKSTIKD